MGKGIVKGQQPKVGHEEGGESSAANHVGDGSRHDHCGGALPDRQRLDRRMFDLLYVEYSDWPLENIEKPYLVNIFAKST